MLSRIGDVNPVDAFSGDYFHSGARWFYIAATSDRRDGAGTRGRFLHISHLEALRTTMAVGQAGARAQYSTKCGLMPRRVGEDGCGGFLFIGSAGNSCEKAGAESRGMPLSQLRRAKRLMRFAAGSTKKCRCIRTYVRTCTCGRAMRSGSSREPAANSCAKLQFRENGTCLQFSG